MGKLKDAFGFLLILLTTIMFFVDYLKEKKTYKLLGVIILFIYGTFISTNFAIGISRSFENILIAIIVILEVSAFYLILKDKKEK